MSKSAVIIPARWGSTRFPGKPLQLLAGKPLVQHVWEQATKARQVDLVVIATDDMRIAEVAFSFGAEVALTSDKHETGTDRIAEVARRLRGYDCIVNVQGDEPLIEPKAIEALVKTIRKDKKLAMATMACPFPENCRPDDPNRVKVVCARNGDALYFSRSLIPFDRDAQSLVSPLLHLGIYAYRRKFLIEFVRWKPSLLERMERLEQLRALENGARIRVIPTSAPSAGVDTPEDLRMVEQLLQAR